MRVTVLMLALFFMAQVVGLLIVNQYIDHQQLKEGRVSFVDLPYGIERPQVGSTASVIYMLAAIFLGTLILLIFIKFQMGNIWKIWFAFSMIVVLTVSFSPFIKIEIPYNYYIASALALLLVAWRLFRPNFYIHNITEVFIYGGLAAIFVSWLNVTAAVVLLIAISIYDMYAVWKSKHMITMARFTAKEKVFAGMLVQYHDKKEKAAKGTAAKADYRLSSNIKNKGEVKHAILGGGDIGFPLIFAGVVMKELMLKHAVLLGFIETLIIVVCTTLALAYLFWKGDKGKFYPAMPYLSAGCFIGGLIVLGIELII